MKQLRTILSLSLLLISTFGVISFAEAGDFCKRGQYFYNASSNTCRSRATNYCYDKRLGYKVCSSETTETVEAATDIQGAFCKRGSYFYHSDDSACSGRSIDYCYTRTRGYHRCESNNEGTSQEASANAENNNTEVTTPEISTNTTEQAQGEYCKVGRYWHFAESPICKGKAIDQCKINGTFGPCGRQEVTAGGATTTTQGYKRMTCGSPKNPFQCMMCNCYHESRGEDYSGRLAVGKVVMTRARMKSYPNSVCSVVYQGQSQTYSQFSWTKSSARYNVMGKVGWNRCEGVVNTALKYNGHYASHYHTKTVYPKWRRNCKGRFTVGAHYFYKDCGTQSRANTGVRVDI